MFRTSSLFLSREKFPSDISIVDRNKNTIYEGEEFNSSSKNPLHRLRSKTRYEHDGSFRKKSFNNRHSVTLPARYKVDENGYIDRMRKISSIENPFTFSEDPILVQQRLQTLGTSDLQVSYIGSKFLIAFITLCISNFSIFIQNVIQSVWKKYL